MKALLRFHNRAFIEPPVDAVSPRAATKAGPAATKASSATYLSCKQTLQLVSLSDMLVFLVYEPLQRGRPEVYAVLLALLDIRLRMTEAPALMSGESKSCA